ncbi:MAG: hypothetical protein LBF72_03890 [Holosporales bacterium]|nr:hypothetical protein [Holosporales bacterium]
MPVRKISFSKFSLLCVLSASVPCSVGVSKQTDNENTALRRKLNSITVIFELCQNAIIEKKKVVFLHYFETFYQALVELSSFFPIPNNLPQDNDILAKLIIACRVFVNIFSECIIDLSAVSRAINENLYRRENPLFFQVFDTLRKTTEIALQNPHLLKNGKELVVILSKREINILRMFNFRANFLAVTKQLEEKKKERSSIVAIAQANLKHDNGSSFMGSVFIGGKIKKEDPDKDAKNEKDSFEKAAMLGPRLEPSNLLASKVVLKQEQGCFLGSYDGGRLGLQNTASSSLYIVGNVNKQSFYTQPPKALDAKDSSNVGADVPQKPSNVETASKSQDLPGIDSTNQQAFDSVVLEGAPPQALLSVPILKAETDQAQNVAETPAQDPTNTRADLISENLTTATVRPPAEQQKQNDDARGKINQVVASEIANEKNTRTTSQKELEAGDTSRVSGGVVNVQLEPNNAGVPEKSQVLSGAGSTNPQVLSGAGATDSQALLGAGSTTPQTFSDGSYLGNTNLVQALYSLLVEQKESSIKEEIRDVSVEDIVTFLGVFVEQSEEQDTNPQKAGDHSIPAKSRELLELLVKKVIDLNASTGQKDGEAAKITLGRLFGW